MGDAPKLVLDFLDFPPFWITFKLLYCTCLMDTNLLFRFRCCKHSVFLHLHPSDSPCHFSDIPRHFSNSHHHHSSLPHHRLLRSSFVHRMKFARRCSFVVRRLKCRPTCPRSISRRNDEIRKMAPDSTIPLPRHSQRMAVDCE